MENINIIELFSGIGGFTKGLEDAGFTIDKHYFSEIDKHAIANYKYNFPNAEYIGSVVDLRPGDFRDINVITFGSPCQDFSLAGKRKGLEGERSSLIQYAIELISHVRPDIFIWENVKGAFSSNNGADFWAILQAFANIGGYRHEWQLLNTKWFLPQNRERIYLVGHLATSTRGFGNVFPIEENDFGFNERAIKTRSIRTLTAGGNSGGLHSSMTLVKTLQGDECLNTIRSGGRGSLTKKHSWDIVQIGAMRGRNPENPTRRESGQPTEQMLELNENGTSNTLTSVTKDNLVVGTWRTHKDGQGFRKVQDDNCPTIPTRARENGSGQPVITEGINIRRLTEIECERLQGFPQQKKFIGLERIKNHAQNVEVKCRKLQKSVLTVEKTDLNLNALFAKQNLNIKQVQKNKLVLENVHINFGENVVEIHNQGKLIFSAKNAESKNWFHPLMKIEDFVLLLVRTNLIQEKKILIGKEEFRVKEQSLTHQKNSKKLVNKYGKETTLLANDAEKDLIILNLLLKFTTSSHLDTKKADVILKTWFSFVIHVIIGFIPEEIQIKNLLNLSLSIDYGWTEYGIYEKQVWTNKKEGTFKIVKDVQKIPKTQRYKMCGNAVTVKVVEEIAKRLKIKL